MSECGYPPCSRPWAICRCCYRGHRYCSKACSQLARLKNNRESNRRHQQGPGRKGHAARQQDYRLRQVSSGTGSKKKVTEQSSNEPPSDGTLVGARRQEDVLSAQPSATAPESNRDSLLSCRRCGRHSVLVEPLAERKRIVTLLRGDRRCQPRSAHSSESSARESFTDYVQAMEALYVELPITPRRLRRDELDVARQLHGEGVRPLHIEAALLVTTARRLLGNEPQLTAPIRSLRDVVPLIEQARRAGVRQGYIDYLRHKLRGVLEGCGADSVKRRERARP